MMKMNIAEIKIKPITNQQEFDEASQIIDTLIDADLIQDPIERKAALDILEAITILAYEYEKKHYSIPKPDPIEAIKERMEQLNLTQKDVAPYFGGENRVSEVLRGKRDLTVKMIKAISKNLRISTETLLGA
jgi:HTH-type transcriptional regulator/antitoxin HigA